MLLANFLKVYLYLTKNLENWLYCRPRQYPQSRPICSDSENPKRSLEFRLLHDMITSSSVIIYCVYCL